jgi:hypothetical protein
VADDVVADPGAGGATFATDDIGGVHHPYTKLEFGDPDTATKVADAGGQRLPVKVAEFTAASLPLPTGAATEATLASVDAAVADVATETTLATRASEATLATRLSEADFDTKTGSLTEAAPGTDTASSGLNGRLQRIAQRITSLIALLPAALVGGRLDVNLGASPTTLTVQDTASKVDDAAFTPATDRVLMVGAEADEGSPDLVDEGDAGALRMTLARALHVNIRDDAGDSAMDGANNAVRVNIVAGAGSGGAAQADRSTFTDGTTQANPIAGVLNDTPTDPTEDQAAAVRITAKRALHVNLRAADGSELSVGGGTQYDEDTASAGADKLTMAGVVRKDTAATLVDTDGDRTQLQVDAVGRLHVNGSGVTQPVSAASLPLPTGAATDVTVASRLSESDFDTKTGSLTEAAPGTDTASSGLNGRLQRIAQRLTSLIALLPAALVSGRLDVNLGAAPATVTVTGTVTAAGAAAHDAAVSGNPVTIAARANANEPTAVADGDVTHLWADLLGRLVVLPGHPSPESPVTLNATASGNTTVISAPGGGVSLYIVKASIHNRDTAVRTVALQDGAGGTNRWKAMVASDGGGSLIDFGARGWKLTANTLLNVNLDAAGNVDVNITEYYIAA